MARVSRSSTSVVLVPYPGSLGKGAALPKVVVDLPEMLLFELISPHYKEIYDFLPLETLSIALPARSMGGLTLSTLKRIIKSLFNNICQLI